MSKSHVLLVPAIREGWGLVVSEANACSTPAIGYNVPGLRDSIVNRYTGILTKNNPESMSEAIKYLISNEKVRSDLSFNSYSMSNEMSWCKSTEKFLEYIKEILYE